MKPEESAGCHQTLSLVGGVWGWDYHHGGCRTALVSTEQECNTYPPCPVPPILLAQNLSSKQIVTTDNVWLNFNDNYTFGLGERIRGALVQWKMAKKPGFHTGRGGGNPPLPLPEILKLSMVINVCHRYYTTILSQIASEAIWEDLNGGACLQTSLVG